MCGVPSVSGHPMCGVASASASHRAFLLRYVHNFVDILRFVTYNIHERDV